MNLKKLMGGLSLSLIPVLSVLAVAGDVEDRGSAGVPAAMMVRVDIRDGSQSRFEVSDLDKKATESETEMAALVAKVAANDVEIDANGVIGLESPSEYDEVTSTRAWYYYNRGPWYRYPYNTGWYSVPGYYRYSNYWYYSSYNWSWGYYRYHFYW